MLGTEVLKVFALVTPLLVPSSELLASAKAVLSDQYSSALLAQSLLLTATEVPNVPIYVNTSFSVSSPASHPTPTPTPTLSALKLAPGFLA